MAAEIEGLGGRALAARGSVAGTDGAARIVEAAQGASDRLDIMVSNADIVRDRTSPDMAGDDFGAVVATHFDRTPGRHLQLVGVVMPEHLTRRARRLGSPTTAPPVRR